MNAIEGDGADVELLEGAGVGETDTVITSTDDETITAPIPLSVETNHARTLVLASSEGRLAVDIPAGTTETTVRRCSDGD